jgi:hypothetical protein
MCTGEDGLAKWFMIEVMSLPIMVLMEKNGGGTEFVLVLVVATNIASTE